MHVIFTSAGPDNDFSPPLVTTGVYFVVFQFYFAHVHVARFTRYLFEVDSGKRARVSGLFISIFRRANCVWFGLVVVSRAVNKVAVMFIDSE